MNKNSGTHASSRNKVSHDPVLSAKGVVGDYETPSSLIDDVHVSARILGGQAAERECDPDIIGIHTIGGK